MLVHLEKCTNTKTLTRPAGSDHLTLHAAIGKPILFRLSLYVHGTIFRVADFRLTPPHLPAGTVDTRIPTVTAPQPSSGFLFDCVLGECLEACPAKQPPKRSATCACQGNLKRAA